MFSECNDKRKTPGAGGPAIDPAAPAGGGVDYRQLFQQAPVGMVVSRGRIMWECNALMCEMFGYSRELLIQQSFEMLYPSKAEFSRQGQRMLPALRAKGRWSDQRMMRRANGEHFWCKVTGCTFNRDDPHAEGMWLFEDLGRQPPRRAQLTGRERDVAGRLLEGLTSKEIGRLLGISHRTVEIHRASLMRKFGASTATDLVHKLLKGLSD